MNFLKWAVIAVIGLLVFNWLRNGLSANASVNASTMQGGWGTGMLYARGSAYTQGPYYYGGSVPAWAMYPPVQYYKPSTPISVDYDPNNGISFQYGY